MSRPYLDGNTFIGELNAIAVIYGGGSLGQAMVDRFFTGSDSSPQKELSKHSSFFRPFKKTKEDLFRIYAPISAPITFALVAAEMAIGCIIKLCSALISIFLFDKEGIVANGKDALKTVGYAILLSIAAIASPVINTIDLIGSVFTTVFNADQSDDSDNALTSYSS